MDLGVAVRCNVGHRRGSAPSLLWLWCRLAAVVLIWPLAWEWIALWYVSTQKDGSTKEVWSYRCGYPHLPPPAGGHLLVCFPLMSPMTLLLNLSFCLGKVSLQLFRPLLFLFFFFFSPLDGSKAHLLTLGCGDGKCGVYYEALSKEYKAASTQNT